MIRSRLTLYQDLFGSRSTRILEDLFNVIQHMDSNTSSVSFPIDVRTKGDKIVARIDVPGFNKDEIEVTLEGGVLSISGERKGDYEEGSEALYVCERTTGRLHRSFRVPTNIDSATVHVTLKNGVLQVIMKRSEESKPRKITIH